MQRSPFYMAFFNAIRESVASIRQSSCASSDDRSDNPMINDSSKCDQSVVILVGDLDVMLQYSAARAHERTARRVSRIRKSANSTRRSLSSVALGELAHECRMQVRRCNTRLSTSPSSSMPRLVMLGECTRESDEAGFGCKE